MPSYYEAVGDEPTYELAEGIIKAFIRDLKKVVITCMASLTHQGIYSTLERV